MNQIIKQRIQQIKSGQVPTGYKKTKLGIVPEEWGIINLKSVLKKQIIKNTNNLTNNILTNSATKGIVNQIDYFNKQIANNDNTNTYYIVKPGYFVYNPRISVSAPCGPFNRYNGENVGIMSPLYSIYEFSHNNKKYSDFLSIYFDSCLWHKYMYSIANYGARSDRMNVSAEDVNLMPLPYPPLLEQEKIAKILETQDKIIELYQRKIEELQKLKKAYLSKMFPKHGSNVPETRFPGFTEDWEQRKLTDFVNFFSGLTYTPNDVQDSGTLVLRSSNVSNGEIVDADNVFVNSAVVNVDNVREGDIIVVVRNGSRSLIGKHAQIKGFMPDTVIGAFMTGIRSQCPAFTNALLNTPHFDEEVAMNMGATINQITGYMFSKMEFTIPRIEEQQQLGLYFANLDNLITLHQRKLEEMKKYKKALMQLLLTGIVRVKQ